MLPGTLLVSPIEILSYKEKEKQFLLYVTSNRRVKDIVSGHLYLLSVSCNSICVPPPSDLPPRPVPVGVVLASGLTSLFSVVAV